LNSTYLYTFFIGNTILKTLMSYFGIDVY